METAPPAEAVPAEGGDRPPLDPAFAEQATARLFRSIRAGRAWVRGRGAAAAGAQTGACVEMKPGNDEPPVFMIPGAPGSILQLGPLAAALAIPMPVYAIPPRGLEGGAEPCTTLAEMAAYNIAAMRAMRPTGPYPLIGYSAGGLVALEMAQQLTAAGHAVPVVVLLDTYPSKQTWPLSCHLEILLRQTGRVLWSLRQYSPSQAVREVVRRLRGVAGYLAESGVSVLPLPEVPPEGWSAASRRVYLASYNAGEAYRPRHYAGKIVFVQPTEIANLEPQAPGRVWRRFLGDLEVRRVPGSHEGIVEDGAAAIAAAIGDCLAAAARARPTAEAAIG